MAESVVAQPPQRFYCHKCNVEIDSVSAVSIFLLKSTSDDLSRATISLRIFSIRIEIIFMIFSQEYTCPLCAGGFIEELPPNGSSERGQSTSSSDDVEMSGEFDNHRMNDRISSLLMSSIGGSLRSFDEDNGESNQDGGASSTFYFNSITIDSIIFLILMRFFLCMISILQVVNDQDVIDAGIQTFPISKTLCKSF